MTIDRAIAQLLGGLVGFWLWAWTLQLIPWDAMHWYTLPWLFTCTLMAGGATLALTVLIVRLGRTP